MKSSLILYHLSPDLKHNGVFIPRIPGNRSSEENKTPRICFSSTVEGCYRSAFWHLGGRGDLDRLALFTLDLSQTPKKYLSPEEIIGKVSDAVKTQEYWVLEAVSIPKVIIRLMRQPSGGYFDDDLNKLHYQIEHANGM
ncbi:hypothetical protein [Paenibacillus taichungensis]